MILHYIVLWYDIRGTTGRHPSVSGIALDVRNEHNKYVPRLIGVETWRPEMDLSEDFWSGIFKHSLFKANNVVIHVSVFL